MAGLTNWARWRFLGNISGAPANAPTMFGYAQLLVGLPTSDGNEAGGTLTDVGAEEWAPGRKSLEPETNIFAVTARWRRVADDGGFSLDNLGEFGWDETDTALLDPSGVKILGGAIYDSLTGGNMVAWGPFSEFTANPNSLVVFPTGKYKLRMFGKDPT